MIANIICICLVGPHALRVRPGSRPPQLARFGCQLNALAAARKEDLAGLSQHTLAKEGVRILSQQLCLFIP
jgi:hypothetical protein